MEYVLVSVIHLIISLVAFFFIMKKIKNDLLDEIKDLFLTDTNIIINRIDEIPDKIELSGTSINKNIDNLNENVKSISENIKNIEIPEVDTSGLKNIIVSSKDEILDKIDHIDANIEVKNGTIKGDLRVEGSVNVAGNVSSFSGGEI